jgi:hypothetical protein
MLGLKAYMNWISHLMIQNNIRLRLFQCKTLVPNIEVLTEQFVYFKF